jgi:hypothetical protein
MVEDKLSKTNSKMNSFKFTLNGLQNEVKGYI